MSRTNRTKTLVVATLVLVGSAVAGVGAVPAAAQTDDDPVVTVEIGALEGATLCAQQVATDTNRLIVRDAAYDDITIYLDENRRIELEQTRSNATMILHTDRGDGPIDRLADRGECLRTDRTDAVVTAAAITTRGLSVDRYAVEVGSNGAVPDANGFGIDGNESDESERSDGPVENVTDPVDESVTDTEETVDDALNETEGAIDETGDRLEETVNETDERLGEPINETGDRLEETVNETEDQLEETVDETGDRLEETVDETGDQVGETVDESGDQLEETANETGDRLEETTDDTGDQLEETADETGDTLHETTAETTGALG